MAQDMSKRNDSVHEALTCANSDAMQTGVCKKRSEDVAILTACGFQHQNSTWTEHFDRHNIIFFY